MKVLLGSSHPNDDTVISAFCNERGTLDILSHAIKTPLVVDSLWDMSAAQCARVVQVVEDLECMPLLLASVKTKQRPGGKGGSKKGGGGRDYFLDIFIIKAFTPSEIDFDLPSDDLLDEAGPADGRRSSKRRCLGKRRLVDDLDEEDGEDGTWMEDDDDDKE